MLTTQNFFRHVLEGPFGDLWDSFSGFRHSDSLFAGLGGWTPAEYPALNAWSNDEEILVEARLPGVEAGDIEVSVEKNVLKLRGQRAAEGEKKSEKCYRRERWAGEFYRALELPFAVDGDKVEARFAEGLLTIKLPRAAEDKPRKIALKAA